MRSCNVAGSGGVYGSVSVNQGTMTASHIPGDAGESVYDPANPDPEDPFEGIAPDDGALADPTDTADGGDFTVAEEGEPNDDMGDGSTYVPGEEDAGDVPVNQTPDATGTETDQQPNGDLIHASVGGSYELTGGVLTVDADSFASMTATAAICATKLELEVDYAYDNTGLRSYRFEHILL